MLYSYNHQILYILYCLYNLCYNNHHSFCWCSYTVPQSDMWKSSDRPIPAAQQIVKVHVLVPGHQHDNSQSRIANGLSIRCIYIYIIKKNRNMRAYFENHDICMHLYIYIYISFNILNFGFNMIQLKSFKIWSGIEARGHIMGHTVMVCSSWDKMG